MPIDLTDPRTWGAPAGTPVGEVQTHISRVFLVGDRAFKVKKAVRMPFLDFTELEARRAACEAEVALNRRLAPRIYLGVRALAGDGGGPVEYAVEMRRFDERDTLAARLDAGTAATEDVEAVARVLAGLHRAAAPVAGPGAADRFKETLDDNVTALLDLCDDRARTARVERTAAVLLARAWTELDARGAAGLVRDGHGDLRAEHVVLAPELAIVDCIEFTDRLRVIDTGYDAAFLVMDLERAGRSDLSAGFVAAYRDAGGDPGSSELIGLFAQARALVRAKVALLRAGQVEPGEARRHREQAGELLDLAERLAWRARGPVAIVVCGPPASGKSTLAAALAAQSGLPVFASDVVRKRLAGLAPTARGEPGLYDAAHTGATYAALVEEAFALPGAGAIVDATFRAAAHRRSVEAAARAAGLALVVVECRLPEEELLRRARERAQRADRVSDATPEVAAEQARAWQPWTGAGEQVVVGTDAPLEAQVAAVADAVDRRLLTQLQA